ncbi:MAG: SPOR domain-containing protein [Bacillota bacterium]|nr:SPOR domain-containing protein [Bacillota bacterium]
MKVYERVRIISILVLGLMALGLLTWGIGKAYLELVGQSRGVKTERVQDSSQKANAPKNTVLSLPEAKFWTCQIGVFQSESNARLRQEQLKVLSIKAEVLNSNPWIVSVGLGHSADDLKGLKQGLLERGISAVSKQMVWPKRTFRVAGNGSQLTAELLTNVNAILRDGLTAQALEKEKEIWDTEAADYPPKDLEGLHQIYRQLRGESNQEEQRTLNLSLYSEYQRVINKLSGK